MMLFENWVVTDQTAETFLRDHNGFNFIIDRLFQDSNQIAGQNNKNEESKSQGSIDSLCSSDESDLNKDEDVPDDVKLKRTQKKLRCRGLSQTFNDDS